MVGMGLLLSPFVVPFDFDSSVQTSTIKSILRIPLLPGSIVGVVIGFPICL